MANDISVFTPTYNRGNYLVRLYDSLLNQTILPKEWIIVDDGSGDNTEEIVENFKSVAPFPIYYFKQINAGKHIAINKGAEIATGELFFVVDSDDYLASNAIERILYHWKNVCELPIDQKLKIIGIGANRVYKSMATIGGNPNYDTIDVDLLTLRYIRGVKGDKAEAYNLAFIKANPFPKIDGETFCPEALIFYRLAYEGYQLRFVNEPLYICEYLEGGLTQSGLGTVRRGPIATLLNIAAIANYENVPIKIRIKHVILFWRFSFLATTLSFREKLDMLKRKWFVVFYPLGTIFYIRDRVLNK